MIISKLLGALLAGVGLAIFTQHPLKRIKVIKKLVMRDSCLLMGSAQCGMSARKFYGICCLSHNCCVCDNFRSMFS